MILLGIICFIASWEIAKRSERWTRLGLPFALALVSCMFLIAGFLQFVASLAP